MKNDTFLKHFENIQTTNIIYMLHHPTSKKAYIGKSTSGLAEPRTFTSSFGLRPVNVWVQDLLKNEQQYEITVLEHFPNPSFLDEAERFYIEYYRSLGMELLNVMDGGGHVAHDLTLPFGFRMKMLMAFEEYGIDAALDVMGLPHAIISRAVLGLRLRRGSISLITECFQKLLKVIDPAHSEENAVVTESEK